MTQQIIYHDFQSTAAATQAAAPGVVLTATILRKGRRLAAVNSTLNIACLTLCGACIGVSLWIITSLFRG